jgi:hypothetical protein
MRDDPATAGCGTGRRWRTVRVDRARPEAFEAAFGAVFDP